MIEDHDNTEIIKCWS